MYYNNYPNLFSEAKIGNITLRNRVVMAPMGTGHTGPDHRFNRELIEFYVERAKGGVGMVISECNTVQTDIDPFPLITGTPRLDSPNKIAKLGDFADMMKYYNTVPCAQISLGSGRQADAPWLAQPVSSSQCPSMSDPNIICRELSGAEIKSLIKSTGRAAEFALTAGIQVVEIHGHSGYLIDQFLSPDINKRTDEYGGSQENRFRIVKEMVEEIRRVVGNHLAVTLRISVDHKMDGYRTLKEGIDYCKRAEEAGFDGLHIDSGRYEVMPWIFPTTYLGPACMVDLAAAVRNVVKIPVIAVGNIGKPEDAEQAIASGSADFVAIARGLLADPEWAEKARTGRQDEIRPCMRCNEMCVGRAIVGKELTCAVNPECGRETYMKIEKGHSPKRVTIIGGGPAGLETAIVASKRGYDVTLLEKANELGGLLNIANIESFKYPVTDLKNYLAKQAELAGVKVHLGQEATFENIQETQPDAVVVATGSDVFVPSIPGFDSEKVLTVRGLKNMPLEGQKEVIVVGGGLVGCETALGLAMDGHNVTIVEMFDEIAKDLVFINKMSLIGELQKYNVNIMTEHKCKSIKDNHLLCTDKNDEELSIPFDYVISATGTRPVNGLNELIADHFPETYFIGDTVQSKNISNAIHQGYITGNRI